MREMKRDALPRHAMPRHGMLCHAMQREKNEEVDEENGGTDRRAQVAGRRAESVGCQAAWALGLDVVTDCRARLLMAQVVPSLIGGCNRVCVVADGLVFQWFGVWCFDGPREMRWLRAGG